MSHSRWTRISDDWTLRVRWDTVTRATEAEKAPIFNSCFSSRAAWVGEVLWKKA